MGKVETPEQALARLRAKRAWGLKGNLLKFSIEELDRQIEAILADNAELREEHNHG